MSRFRSPAGPALAALAAMTSLAACGAPSSPETNDEVEANLPPPAERETDAAANDLANAGSQAGPTDDQAQNGTNDERGEATGVRLPPPGDLRFVGLWATDAANCQSTAWRFSPGALRTPAGSACTFDDRRKAPGGFDISATCTAEGPPTKDTLKLRFAESAQAMLFESGTIADAGLIYCGPLE